MDRRRGEPGMTVQSILTAKGTEVVSTSAKATLREAAEAMTKGKFGALVVSETGKTVDGILSERDIVHMVAEHGAGALDMKVADAMTTTVVTCNRTDRIDDIMAQMSERHFRHMPVIEDGTLVGMVSMTDIMRKKLADLHHEASALRDFIRGH